MFLLKKTTFIKFSRGSEFFLSLFLNLNMPAVCWCSKMYKFSIMIKHFQVLNHDFVKENRNVCLQETSATPFEQWIYFKLVFFSSPNPLKALFVFKSYKCFFNLHSAIMNKLSKSEENRNCFAFLSNVCSFTVVLVYLLLGGKN